MSARQDIIFATGRSDYPNQINNVLGFPYIFRGALDVRAKCINEEMKLAAVQAIAQLTKQRVPDVVNAAYNLQRISFGREYIIPKPLDPRLLTTVAPAVAKAAIESGVARKTILTGKNTMINYAVLWEVVTTKCYATSTIRQNKIRNVSYFQNLIMLI